MAYQYTARNALGKIFSGALSAGSPGQALQSLSSDGLRVMKLESPERPSVLFRRQVRRAEIIYLTSQLAVMTDTGMTLAAALEAARSQEANPSLRDVLADLQARVEEGEDFSVALSRHPRCFSRTYVALIRSSEQTGTLAETLEQLAGQLRRELEHRQKARAALAYPCVMLAMAIAVTIFLLTFVMPRFTPIFESRGGALPAPTRILMSISDLLIDHWGWWLGAVAALAAGVLYARRTPQGRQAIDRWKIQAPLLGPLFRKTSLSRSIATLGAMVQSGVSVLDALRLSADVSGNVHYQQLWLRVLDEVTKGRRIHEALLAEPLVPRALVQMIAAGEESGKLDYVLRKVSSHYDSEVETSLKTVTGLIEPLLIIVMGVVVGGIGLSLLLPIFSLSRAG